MDNAKNIRILKSRKEEAENDGYKGFANALDASIKAIEKLEKIHDLFVRYDVANMRKMSLTSGFENKLCEVLGYGEDNEIK